MRVLARQFVTRSTIAAFMAFMIASHDPSVRRDGVEPTGGMGSGTVVLPHRASFLFVRFPIFGGRRGLAEGAND